METPWTWRVPNGYWSVRSNRLKYMRWLGKRMGYTTLDDWYQATRMTFHKNNGGGMLWTAYKDSPYAAICDCFPRRKWRAWLFTSTPQRYWRDPANRREYMDWLGKQMKLKSDDDWHRVTKDDFYANEGGGLLSNYYENSVSMIVRDYLKKKRRYEWEYVSVPQRFWSSAANRKRYMQWLGKKLEFRKPEDWYQLSRTHFHANRGGTLFVKSGGAPLNVMREFMPKYDWKPWLFARVPCGFWKTYDNRLGYLTWLGKELGFRRPVDWYQIRREDLARTGGGAMLNMCYNNAICRVLKERYPNYKWNLKRLYVRNGYNPQPGLFDDM